MTLDREPKAQWYRTLPETDRVLIDAVGDWLAPVPWQFFATLEFPRNVRSETAVSKLKEWLNNTERQLRDSICFVAGLEERSKSGAPVPAHFHILMTASRPIPASVLEDGWRAMVGRGTRSPLHPEGDSVVLEAVNPAGNALAYCLKFANDCRGDWMFKWLEIFNPNIPRSANHHLVRRRKRGAVDARRVALQPVSPQIDEK